MLDDLPQATAVLCTSNSKIDELEDRFQSRFQAFEVKPPQTSQITDLLSKWNIPPAIARQIAVMSCGNVRQALMDAQGQLAAAA